MVLSLLSLAGCLGSASPAGSNPALAPPSSLKARLLGGGIHLTWTDNASDEDEYQIERKGGDDFRKIATVTFNIVQFHDEAGLSAGTTYTYRVRGVNAKGTSDYSNEATMQLDSAPIDMGAESPPDLAGADLAGSVAVSFKNDIVPILTTTCGSALSGCHRRNQYAATLAASCAGWLALEDASLGAQYYEGAMDGQSTGCANRTLYERLTQLDAWQQCGNPKKKYIKANEPANSYLYNKIAGGPYCGERCDNAASDPMPPPSPYPACLSATVTSTFTLAPAAKTKIFDWIMAGAPNN